MSKEDIIERMKRLSKAGRQAEIPPAIEANKTKVIVKQKGYLDRLFDKVDKENEARRKAKANNKQGA